jgi:zinc metalloprotease ZmpB
MTTLYDSGLKAQVTRDDRKRVRHIIHNEHYWESEDNIPRLSAGQYLHAVADTLQIPKAQLTSLHKQGSHFDPREQGVEFQLAEEKHLFDAITVGYAQTYLNVPVWRKGVSVTIKQNPNRVVESASNTEDDLRGKLPDVKAIKTFQTLFRQVEMRKLALKAGLGYVGEAEDTGAFVLGMFVSFRQPCAVRS